MLRCVRVQPGAKFSANNQKISKPCHAKRSDLTTAVSVRELGLSLAVIDGSKALPVVALEIKFDGYPLHSPHPNRLWFRGANKMRKNAILLALIDLAVAGLWGKPID